jgi:RNA polymerase-binding transcription factor DksA
MAAFTQDQLTQLRRALEFRHSSVLADIRREFGLGEESPFAAYQPGPMDLGEQSVADLLKDVRAALADRQILTLRDVTAARRRLRDGTYGVCVDCGSDIGFARLTVQPTAQRCLVCEARYEKQSGLGSPPTL